MKTGIGSLSKCDRLLSVLKKILDVSHLVMDRHKISLSQSCAHLNSVNFISKFIFVHFAISSTLISSLLQMKEANLVYMKLFPVKNLLSVRYSTNWLLRGNRGWPPPWKSLAAERTASSIECDPFRGGSSQNLVAWV